MISVSTLNQYSYCPRSIYLENVLKIKPKPSPQQKKGLVGHAIRKELALRQAKLISDVSSPQELEEKTNIEIEDVITTAPRIHRHLLEEIDFPLFLKELEDELKQEKRILLNKLSMMMDQLGLEKSLKILTPWKVEYSVRCKELGLQGRVDQVLLEETHIPIELKTGTPPKTIWSGHRLQVCAYTILLEERFGKTIDYGYIEYTRIAERQPVLSTEKLRREVFWTRKEVQAILDGSLPPICPHGNRKKCEACSFEKECFTL